MKLDLVRDKAKVMPLIEDRTAVRHLRVWHCSYKTLESLSAFSNLESLTVAMYPDASLNHVQALSQLRYLRIVHMPLVEDLAPLADLVQLRTLLLETSPGWDAAGKRTIVQSLTPIGNLGRLEHLALFGVVSSDRSLKSLERCSELRSAQFLGFPKEEVSRFYRVKTLANVSAPDSVW